MSDIEVEIQRGEAGSAATLTMNRPERLNALTLGMLEELLRALDDLASDPEVRVIVLSGAGRGFCAGGDLGAARAERTERVAVQSEAARVTRLRRSMRISQLLHEMPQITLAAVNGPCAGAGMSLACACDLRIASDQAVFRTAFLTAGLSGDFGLGWLLPRLVGTTMARQLLFLPDRLDAAEAHRIGLVGQVVAHDELAPAVEGVVARLMASAPLTLAAMKANQADAERLGFSDYLDREAARHVATSRTEDAAEAGRAFLEKRPPRFKAR